MPEQDVDLSKFRRTSTVTMAGSYGRYTLGAELHTIAQLGYGMDPRHVPVAALQLMFTNPAVYLAWRTISGIVRRPDLWSVRHRDPRVRAEVEAWLWPLLPVLTAAMARAFAYGTVAVVLDWERRTLKIVAPGPKGKERTKTLKMHTHFARAFEVHPDLTTFELDVQGSVVSVSVQGARYAANRAHVWTWDGEFGSLVGQGALRRAWRPYCEHLILTLLRDKYLERSVDSVRVSYSPEGEVTVDGTTYQINEYVGTLIDSARGSGSINLPSVRDATGNKKYELDTLEVPDRADVWDQALNRCEAEMFVAFLVAATLSGGLDDAGGAASKTLDGMLREHVEDLATWGAVGLSRIVQLVHAANHGPDDEPADVAATDVGKAAARKIFQEVLRLANSASRGEVALCANIPVLLDKLGVPLREPPLDPFDGEDPSAAEPGRDREPGSERDDRRDDARSEDGEEDTGGEEVDGDEREEQA